MQAFTIFSNMYHLTWLPPIIALCIILGGMGGVSTWIIGPTKGLLVAAQDGSLPTFLTKTNTQGVPSRILVLQASLVSALSFLFILMPTVNSSYWILSVITAQLALLVYIILFSAAIKLHYHNPHIERSFRIPGGKFGIWFISLLGIVSCAAVTVFGFWPPSVIPFQSLFWYETILGLGLGISFAIPYIFLRFFRSAGKNKKSNPYHD
jgi:amino acid transporter